MSSVVTVNTDGGARGNPGPAALGVHINGPLGERDHNRCLGVTTNNVAEYTAVIEGLDLVQEYLKEADGSVGEVKFFLDSELVVRQLNGQYRVKDVNLQDLWIRVQSRARQLGVPCSFQHVRREHNKAADRLVNQALDAEQAGSSAII